MKNHAKSRTVTVSCVVAALVVVSAALLLLRRRGEPALPRPTALPVPGRVSVKPVVTGDAALAPTVEVPTSRAVAIVCGEDAEMAGRYESRNGALRSIARRRDLPKGDVAALMGYLRSHDPAMREERVAALKNDVMNLLRNQEPPPKGLVEVIKGPFRICCLRNFSLRKFS